MPTKATPADVFDFDAWIGRPPLAKVTVFPTGGGKKTIVVRANNVEDNEWLQGLFKEDDSLDPGELLLTRCIVGIWQGGEDVVDLDTVDIPAEPIMTRESVRKIRLGLLEAQWMLVEGTMQKASLTRPEPDAPSSPKS